MIARCSQPEVGWLGWRNPQDEQLCLAISKACRSNSANNGNSSPDEVPGQGTQIKFRCRLLCAFEIVEKLNKIEVYLTQQTFPSTATEETSGGPKLLIIDARSYAAGLANRAKGGGTECPGEARHVMRVQFCCGLVWQNVTSNNSPVAEYYGNAEIQHMGLANIHTVRKSFQAMRTLCSYAPDHAR